MNIQDLRADELAAFADYDGHERVRRIEDPETGLLAFIGVHNRNLGPALGGCRMLPYESEAAAIRDVLRLSRGMTYKNALAGLPLGGGKSVIIGDPFKIKNEALMTAMGRAVNSLKGDYITAEDSGTGERDMIAMAKETEYVVGLPGDGTGDLGGNPSPITAWGVYSGIRAATRHRYGANAMIGLKVAVQGLGAVGYDLCRYLYEEGVELVVTDVRQAVLEQICAEMPDVHVMQPENIFSVDANVFAPCALGAQLNENTIPQMNFDIVAGAANNQLATSQDEDRLTQKNILYVPDYAINAGGVIAVAYEYFRRIDTNPFPYALTRDAMIAHVGRIEQTIEKIFLLAEQQNITTGRAADRLAESIFLHRQRVSGI
ncbi:MAG: Glu/Leu/Phe/Val dehydrogenase [Micavibrio aeruginosavorus]|nr:Glu/Leu/Phe/Val dehydrogenase [Micavibrio aeruginosavorus]